MQKHVCRLANRGAVVRHYCDVIGPQPGDNSVSA